MARQLKANVKYDRGGQLSWAFPGAVLVYFLQIILFCQTIKICRIITLIGVLYGRVACLGT